MYKKILLSIFLLISYFAVTSYSAECYFDNYNSACDIVTEPFAQFDISFSDDIREFSAMIYSKNNPTNKINTQVEGFTVKNINPLVEPGVYVLDIKAFDKVGRYENHEVEFVFDNTKPLPPVIYGSMISNSATIAVEGKTRPGNSILIKDENDALITTIDSDENGDFTATINLPNKINFFKFYSENPIGMISQPNSRVIYFEENLLESESGVVESINLDNLLIYNERTILSQGVYTTTNRDFYVQGTLSGTGLKGTKVSINGYKTLSLSDGKFGGFVLLNEGENIIEIKSGDALQTLNVEYIKPNFFFEEVNVDKVVLENRVQVTGSVNYDVPFDAYLNGKFISEINPTSGSFDFTLIDLKEGRNHIYISGFNGKDYSQIVYYDTDEPSVSLISPENISESKNIVFEIKDDVGVDISSLEANIGDNVYDSSDFEMKGDFFVLNVSDLPEGSHDLNVVVKDLSGKEKSFSKSVFKGNDKTALESIYVVTGGYQIGDKLFVKTGENTLLIDPSRFVSFKKIYLDGVEQIDYDIKVNGNIEANMDFKNTSGTLKFVFINNDYEEFSQVFTYYADSEKPKVELDYVNNPYVSENGKVFVSGKIIDSHFDWSSLLLNNENNFLRFGDYFEGYVSLENTGMNNLIITGVDYSGNEISNGIFGNMLFKDTSIGEVEISDNSVSSFTGSILNADTKVKNFVASYDGFDLRNTYVKKDAFEIPSSQRQGLRSFNMKGVESSGIKIRSLAPVTIDTVKPKIYFTQSQSDGFMNVIIDGTLSDISTVMVDGSEVVVSNTCSSYTKVGHFDTCLKLEKVNGTQVYVEDSYGNYKTKTYEGNLETIIYDDISPIVYFNGNDIKVSEPNYFIQGQVLSDAPLKSIVANGESCIFDDYNFICDVTLDRGYNEFEVIAKDINDFSNSSNITIILDDMPINVNIDRVFGDGVYKLEDLYYLLLDSANIEATVDKISLITINIDGRKIPAGIETGEFEKQIDFKEQLSGKNSDEFDVWLEAEDEIGNKGISEKVTFIYNRLLETIVSVIVG